MSRANALLPTLVLLLQASLIRPKMLARNVRAKVLKELHMEVVSHVSRNLFDEIMYGVEGASLLKRYDRRN